MTSLRWIACAVFILSLAAACSGASSKANQAIKNDFKRYVAQIASIADIEVAADEAHKQAVSAPNANDAAYARALRETIVPKYEEFEREIARIHPTTNEILGLHKILLTRISLEVQGFKELERAARTGDAAAIPKANALFADGKFYYNKWAQQMGDLGKQYSNDK